jgi:hypothetical protein
MLVDAMNFVAARSVRTNTFLGQRFTPNFRSNFSPIEEDRCNERFRVIDTRWSTHLIHSVYLVSGWSYPFHKGRMSRSRRGGGNGLIARRANILVRFPRCCESPIIWRVAWSSAAGRRAKYCRSTASRVLSIARGGAAW